MKRTLTAIVLAALSGLLSAAEEAKTDPAKVPVLDAKKFTFTLGKQALRATGPCNFVMTADGKTVADLYMSFSRPDGSRYTAGDSWPGPDLAKKGYALTENTADAKTGVITSKGILDFHAKGGKIADETNYAWIRTIKTRPDGKIEITFRNMIPEASLAALPYKTANGFFFRLNKDNAKEYRTTQHRMKELSLKNRWNYYRIEILSTDEKYTFVIVNETMSPLNNGKDKRSFYFVSSGVRDLTFTVEMIENKTE